MGKRFSCMRNQDATQHIGRKVVIVGDGACGKTCMITRMSSGVFWDGGYLPTVVDTFKLDVDTGHELVELLVYDTAGQEDYVTLRPLFYRDVSIVVMCFSMEDPDTLDNVRQKWVHEIRHYCGNVPIILVGNKKDLRGSLTPLTTSPPSPASKPPAPSTGGEELSPEIEEEDMKVDISRSYTDDVITMKNFKRSSRKTMNSNSTRPRLHAKHSEGILTAKEIGAIAYFETSALTGENAQELSLAIAKAAFLGPQKSKNFRPFAATLQG